MKKPTILPFANIDGRTLLKELTTHEDFKEETRENIALWLIENMQDILIFDTKEEGFESWTEEDYNRMMTRNHSEPYTMKLKTYTIMHDCC